MAILFKAVGAEVEVMPANGRSFTLAELQGFVGGYIEMVRGPHRDDRLVLNEDGKRLALPPNAMATFLYHLAGGLLSDVVVGDVVLGTTTELGFNDDDDEATA